MTTGLGVHSSKRIISLFLKSGYKLQQVEGMPGYTSLVTVLPVDRKSHMVSPPSDWKRYLKLQENNCCTNTGRNITWTPSRYVPPNKPRIFKEVIYNTTGLDTYWITSKSWFKTQNVWSENLTIMPLFLSSVRAAKQNHRFQKTTV